MMQPMTATTTVGTPVRAAIRRGGGPPRAAHRRAPKTAELVALVGARSRLMTELRSIAYDVLGPYESDELPPDTARWIEAATASAVRAACDTSLPVLAAALDQELAEAPPSVLQHMHRAADRHRAGFF